MLPRRLIRICAVPYITDRYLALSWQASHQAPKHLITAFYPTPRILPLCYVAAVTLHPAARYRYQILIVEDDDLIRLIIVDFLKDAGFEVIEASHAAEALSLLRDLRKAVDLLFTDIQMPGQMNGVDLANHFLAHHPLIPVILTSGTKCPKLAANHHRFVAKPYDPRHVEQHIREMVS